MALKIEGFQAFLRKETQTQILQLNFSEPILAGLGLFLKLPKLSFSELWLSWAELVKNYYERKGRLIIKVGDINAYVISSR